MNLAIVDLLKLEPKNNIHVMGWLDPLGEEDSLRSMMVHV